VETLDYKTPERDSKPRWRRRYAIFVPIFGLSYYGLFFIWLTSILPYFDSPFSPPQWVEWLDSFSIVLAFPLFTIFHDEMVGGRTGLIFLSLLNAAIWGFSIVGIWHCVWAIRQRKN
jgi:hypothetical protein